MSFAKVYSRGLTGIDAPEVSIEVHLSGGLPRMVLVGLAESSVKESKDRVRSAIINNHFHFPNKVITVNLAPASLSKAGSRYDLPIALAILAASNQIPIEALHEYDFIGELGLSGEIRGVDGALPAAIATHRDNRTLILPRANADSAALCHATLLPASHLMQVCAHLSQTECIEPYHCQTQHETKHHQDLADCRGQSRGTRALELAAAGGHNLLFSGPPGVGKSMLSMRLPSILPDLSEAEAIAVAAIRSLDTPGSEATDFFTRPFRAPHHSASMVALIGGGKPIAPGEVSLAHHGILFLDELPEFSRIALECLREPLENKQITISRANQKLLLPAQFQLIGAMNPCPCGFAGSNLKDCQCSPHQIMRYQQKLSGPFLDRIEIKVTLGPPTPQPSEPNRENSALVRGRVITARARQMTRQNCLNHDLSSEKLHSLNSHNRKIRSLLDTAAAKFSLSYRAYNNILKLARTIADLAGESDIRESDIAESLSYRFLGREYIR